MEGVLVFSIGPVQDFIATARKTRDLWFGSWLLSEMSRAAALAVSGSSGAKLVVPAPSDKLYQDTANVSNRLLLMVDEAAADSLASAMEEAVRTRLDEVLNAVFSAVGSAGVDVETARAQVMDLPEILWAFAPVGDSGEFSEARRRAEALLAARKNRRDFRQPSWGSHCPKSSLDGARESVLTPKYLPRQLGALRADEKLCGVGLMKRFGHSAATKGADGSRVLSTSHLASWSLRRGFVDAPADAVEAWRRQFESYQAELQQLGADLSQVPGRPDPVLGRVDGHCLYEGRLKDIIPEDSPRNLLDAQRALSRLLRGWRQTADDHGRRLPALSPYYAVLRGDGDRVGVYMDSLRDDVEHAEASRALARFAESAREVIAHHHGHAVFAGGDDVLALLPVHTTAACARALSEAFKSAVQELPKAGGGRSQLPTFSVGVAIQHLISPLSDGLQGAKTAEHMAKEDYGRDAWVIIVDKRSGSPTCAGGSWTDLAGLEGLISKLQAAQTEGDRKGLPRGLPHDIETARCALDHSDLADLQRLEMERVIKHKKMPSELEDALLKLLPDSDLDGVAMAQQLGEFTRRMLVARALSGMAEERT